MGIIKFYSDLSGKYGWTPSEIDEQEIEMLFDYVIAMSNEEEDGIYIDEVL